MNQSRLAGAIAFAAKCHLNQFRWGGEPYVTHPIRVMEALQGYGESVQIVAVLHDVLEDCDIEIRWLRHDAVLLLLMTSEGELDGSGFQLTIEEYAALDAITRRKKEGEEYPEYVERVASNRWAAKVKIADVQDNLRTISPDSRSHRKHKAALERLVGE